MASSDKQWEGHSQSHCLDNRQQNTLHPVPSPSTHTHHRHQVTPAFSDEKDRKSLTDSTTVSTTSGLWTVLAAGLELVTRSTAYFRSFASSVLRLITLNSPPNSSQSSSSSLPSCSMPLRANINVTNMPSFNPTTELNKHRGVSTTMVGHNTVPQNMTWSFPIGHTNKQGMWCKHYHGRA